MYAIRSYYESFAGDGFFEFTAGAVIGRDVMAGLSIGDGASDTDPNFTQMDFGFRERDSFARLDENPVVSLAVVKSYNFV